MNNFLTKAWRGLKRKSYSREFLVGPDSPWAADNNQIIRPDDFAAQIKEYRGLVYACVKIKSNAVGSVPLKLFVARNSNQSKFRHTRTRAVSTHQKDFLFEQDFSRQYLKAVNGVEEITTHPVLELLHNVSGYKTASALRFETTMFDSLAGNCYWYLPKNGLGKPAEIRVIHPQYIRPIPDKKDFISGYIYKRGGQEIKYDVDEIIHFLTPGPHNAYVGMGDVAGEADHIGLRGYMTEYEISVFQKMGYPEIALKSTKDVSDPDAMEMLRQWKYNYGGHKKGGTVAFLHEWLSIEPLQITSPRDMQYTSGYKMMREEIAAGFGIPMSYLIQEGASKAISLADQQRFARNTVLPELTHQVEKLNEQLIPKYDGEGYFFGFDDPIPQDRVALVEELKGLVGSGIITIDEGREKLKYPPKGIDYLLVPRTMIPIDQAGADIADAQATRIFSLAMEKAKDKYPTMRV